MEHCNEQNFLIILCFFQTVNGLFKLTCGIMPDLEVTALCQSLKFSLWFKYRAHLQQTGVF